MQDLFNLFEEKSVGTKTEWSSKNYGMEVMEENRATSRKTPFSISVPAKPANPAKNIYLFQYLFIFWSISFIF